MIVTAAFLFISCIWCHIVDDYVLQGCLANLKQRDWWKFQIAEKMRMDLKDTMYSNDYIMGLICHSMSWAFTIMIPLIWCRHDTLGFYVIAFCINAPVHAIVDHLKANAHWINLVEDQCIHFIQVFLTVFLWMMLVYR